MIARQVKRTTTSPGRARVRVVVTGDPCQRGTQLSRVCQAQLLEVVAQNHTLHACDYEPFERGVISHNGTCWQFEFEAEVDDVQEA